MIDRETMMASTPVIRRLGIMVIAGSPPKILNSFDSPPGFYYNSAWSYVALKYFSNTMFDTG